MVKQGKSGGCGTLLIICLIIGIVTTYWPIILAILGIVLVIALIRKSKLKNSPLGNVNFDAMDGHQFEYFCAKALRTNGFQNVKVTQGSGDHGIDILANLNGTKYAIQCKRYEKNVGNKAIQEAFSGKAIYGADIAVVMTNSYFTEQAKSDARNLGVQLWDRKKVLSLIRSADGNVVDLDENKEKIVTENDILRKYNDNREKGELRILDTDEKIVAIEDGEISKYLYQYLESASRIAIDTYLENRNENSYVNDMIKNVVKPIKLQNAKFIKIISDFHIEYLYYCKMDNDFKSTLSYKKLVEVAEKNKYNDMFEIEVRYEIDDILLEGREAKFKNVPEVNINLSNMEWINNDDVDEWEEEAGYRYLVTETFFPMKIDNMKFNATQEEEPKKIEIDEGKIRLTCAKISNQFSCFGIKIEVLDINSDSDNIIFCIRQEQGVRVKTIISYKPDISLAIGAECEMKLISEKGYIGIFVPIKYFIKSS